MSRKENSSRLDDLSVIIPQYKNWAQTVACCSSLWQHHGEDVSIIVVDDGSGSYERKMAKRYLSSRVGWVEQPHLGVSAAWNLGIRESRSRFIVLLNNDALSVSPWLGGVCGQLSKRPGQLVGAETRKESLLSRLKRIDSSDEYLLAGWCLCFERRTFERVGLFDASMRLYWSDTDWQLRWKETFGRSSSDFGLIDGGSLRHAGHVTTRELEGRSMCWRKDRAVFFAKWG